ncbi:MAG: hypothetical protein RR247_01960 [Clostridia bacterium]
MKIIKIILNIFLSLIILATLVLITWAVLYFSAPNVKKFTNEKIFNQKQEIVKADGIIDIAPNATLNNNILVLTLEV